MRPPIDTIYPAVSAEFCPSTGFQHILACGTYKLLQPSDGLASDPRQNVESENTGRVKQTRLGKCLMFNARCGVVDDTLEKTQEMASPGILDMKWCHRSNDSSPVLGVANADGCVTLHQWNHEETQWLEFHSISLGSDALSLSLDWSNRRWPSSGLGSLVVSLSDGTVSVLRPDNSAGLTQHESWSAHEFEPWIAAWDYWDLSFIYSGGDDVKLKGWDIRQGFNTPVFVYKRFDAGVTAIQSHPYVEHVFAAGSYDSTVRIFDSRKPSKPLQEMNVGGGVWRVKWHPSPERKNDLLMACMHDGFKVLRCQTGTSNEEYATAEVAKRYDGHESLAYGVDWSYARDSGTVAEEDTLVASCSFYDHSLHLWRG